MHVHSNYNLQLATLGVNRDEVQEMAARRAAETRRRLSTVGQEFSGEFGEVTAAAASPHTDSEDHPNPQQNASSGEGERDQTDDGPASGGEQGRLFSARA